MAQVTVTINGRGYQIACDDGQEAHLSRLAGYLDGKVGELTEAVGQIGDTQLLVMAGLLVADELSDMREVEGDVADRLDALAARIEDIAGRLEGT